MAEMCVVIRSLIGSRYMATKQAQTANTPVDGHWLLAGSVSLLFEEVQIFRVHVVCSSRLRWSLRALPDGRCNMSCTSACIASHEGNREKMVDI
jgi:hypothetical protein